MSILLGLVVCKERWNGSTYCQKDLQECSDLQDVRSTLRHVQEPGGLLRDMVERAEVHDTDNGRTWSVNGDGISKKDYHYEDTERFRKRWLHKWQR